MVGSPSPLWTTRIPQVQALLGTQRSSPRRPLRPKKSPEAWVGDLRDASGPATVARVVDLQVGQLQKVQECSAVPPEPLHRARYFF